MKPSFLNKTPQARRKTKSPVRKRVRAKVKHRAKTSDTEEEIPAKKSGCKLPFLLIVLGISYAAYHFRDHWSFNDLYQRVTQSFNKEEPKPPKHIPDPVKYEQLKVQLANERFRLNRRYLNARTNAQRHAVLEDASALLEVSMPKLMRCWLGHPWDFNGTATVPGKGKIACGYFVSVIMRDAGFNITTNSRLKPRIKLAQQPSQRIITTFIPERKDIWITGGKKYQSYHKKLEENYHGINIVGLDRHVGFVVVEQGKMHFIHSGGLLLQVVDETGNDAYSLRTSNYRVIANISRNRALLEKWVLGKPLPVSK